MKIEDYLKGNFEKHTASFLSFKNLHPVLEEFKTEILNINISTLSLNFQREIKYNLDNYWFNKELNPDYNEKLLAILFTYGFLDDSCPKALAYGITKSQNKLQNSFEPFDLEYHDYANGFYAMPGITLSHCKLLNKLNWRNIDEDKYPNLEVYELEGRNELFNSYKYAIDLALHIAINKLNQENSFEKIPKELPFHFLLQEHDENVRNIFIIE
jgi:hypothetical protein